MSQLDFQIGLLENPEEMRNCKNWNLQVFPENLYGKNDKWCSIKDELAERKAELIKKNLCFLTFL